MKVWKIPQHDEMPSEEMIGWLSEMTQEWDGDESGITITSPEGKVMVGSPGDYVVESDGVYYIVTAAEFAEGNSILNQLGYQP
jgi:hypothetical protein